MKDFYVTKVDGTSELFQREKLEHSLLRAGASPEIVKEITDRIVERATSGMTTSIVYKMAFRELARKNRPIAARYSLRRALFDLGPTGFPFEDFVGALFEQDGYDVSLRQTVEGKCISHELDVLAKKDGECLGIEVKFHNRIGYKTDVKTALYVKSRMDDLYAPDAATTALACKVNKGILLTNTKFTSGAVTYASCVGLSLIGWSHPGDESLLSRMTRLGVYPITALTTLSASQKRSLLGRGVVLCKTLDSHREALVDVGLSVKKIDAVLNEAKDLCANPHETA